MQVGSNRRTACNARWKCIYISSTVRNGGNIVRVAPLFQLSSRRSFVQIFSERWPRLRCEIRDRLDHEIVPSKGHDSRLHVQGSRLPTDCIQVQASRQANCPRRYVIALARVYVKNKITWSVRYRADDKSVRRETIFEPSFSNLKVHYGDTQRTSMRDILRFSFDMNLGIFFREKHFLNFGFEYNSYINSYITVVF